MQQHLQKLDQNYQQIEIMKQELAEQKQRILDTEQSFLYQNYDEPIEPKFNEQQAYSPLSLQSPIQPIDLESQLDYDYQNYVGQYVDEDYVGSENFTLHSPIANVYNDMRENQFEEEGYDVDDDDDDENYNNEQGRDQDYDLRGDHRPRPHQKVQFTPKSNQNKIVPNQFNAELIAMLQEQFLIAHNKLEQENKQEREKMIEEITNLKNELTKKQKEFEKRTLELKRNEMIKVEPLSEDITANRLNTRTIIVPIVTNSSICRLDEKHDYNDYVDPRGYDEEHEESLEIMGWVGFDLFLMKVVWKMFICFFTIFFTPFSPHKKTPPPSPRNRPHHPLQTPNRMLPLLPPPLRLLPQMLSLHQLKHNVHQKQ